MMDHNLPIVQPLVLTRYAPFGPVMMIDPVADKDGFFYRGTLDNLPHGGLLEVGAVGAAGMLIRRDVLNSISDPWFENPPNKIAEDITFCRKATEKGFKIYTDLSNVMGHLNVGSVTPVVHEGKWMTELKFGDGTYYLPAVKGKTK
jgi:hypothetical protein